jgi:hypothetical protein
VCYFQQCNLCFDYIKLKFTTLDKQADQCETALQNKAKQLTFSIQETMADQITQIIQQLCTISILQQKHNDFVIRLIQLNQT